jgi:hypothetical protein
VRGREGGGLLVHFMAFSGHLTGCGVIDVVWARGDVAWSPPGLASTACVGGSRERVQEGEGNVGEASKLLQDCARAAARRERAVGTMQFSKGGK